MLDVTQKLKVAQACLELAQKMSSTERPDWAAAATRLGVAESTIRYNIQDVTKWSLVSDKKFQEIAKKLSLSFTGDAWNTVETANTKMVTRYLKEAQTEGIFFCIVAQAAQGKTAACERYADTTNTGFVLYMKIEEAWSHKRFMTEFAAAVGVRVTTTMTVADIQDEIMAFWRRQTADVNALIIFDEAINLRPASLRILKPLYDEFQDRLGCVLIGADDLQTKIVRAVKRDVAGMDQVESRLGRSYRALPGILQADVVAICNANGVTDEAVQMAIWADMKPQIRVAGKEEYFEATEGLRRLKHFVKRAVSQRIKKQ